MNISKYVLQNKNIELYIKRDGEDLLVVKALGNTMSKIRRERLEGTLSKSKDIRRICDKIDELSISVVVLDEKVESYLYDWL